MNIDAIVRKYWDSRDWLSGATISAAFAVALSGCAGGSPFASQSDPSMGASSGFDQGRRQPFSQLAQQFPQSQSSTTISEETPYPPTEASHDNRFLSSVRNTGSAIGNAFAIQPRVVPAADATSLATPTGDVGAGLHYHAAQFQETRQNTEAALTSYQRSLEMNPHDVRTMIGYARVLDRTQRFKEAETTYLRALELEPGNAIALNDLGMIYARQGLLEPSVERLQQAIQLQPTNQRYRNNLAGVLIDAGRVDEAYGHLAAVHGEAVAHYNVGYLLYHRKHHEAASAHWQQALALNPQLEPARLMLHRLAAHAPPPQLPGLQPPYLNISIPATPEIQAYPQRVPTANGLHPLPPL